MYPFQRARIEQQLFYTSAYIYAESGILLNLASIYYTLNEAWANNEDGWNMRSQLRKGSYRDLNLYIMRNPGEGIAGYAYLPANLTTDGHMFTWDGIALRSSYVYNEANPSIGEYM